MAFSHTMSAHVLKPVQVHLERAEIVAVTVKSSSVRRLMTRIMITLKVEGRSSDPLPDTLLCMTRVSVCQLNLQMAICHVVLMRWRRSHPLVEALPALRGVLFGLFCNQLVENSTWWSYTARDDRCNGIHMTDILYPNVASDSCKAGGVD